MFVFLSAGYQQDIRQYLDYSLGDFEFFYTEGPQVAPVEVKCDMKVGSTPDFTPSQQG